MESALVRFHVVADLRPLGKGDMPVDDRTPDPRMPTHVYVVVNDGIGDLAVAVDAHVVPQNRTLHAPSRDDGAARHNGVDGYTHAFRVRKHKLRREILVLPP